VSWTSFVYQLRLQQKKARENEGHPFCFAFVPSSVLPSKMTVMPPGENKGKLILKV
jgi:hypothetical protein